MSRGESWERVCDVQDGGRDDGMCVREGGMVRSGGISKALRRDGEIYSRERDGKERQDQDRWWDVCERGKDGGGEPTEGWWGGIMSSPGSWLRW